MRVNPASPAEPAPLAVSEPGKSAGGASFAALHAASVAKLSSAQPSAPARATAQQASAGTRSTAGAAEFKVPKSETYEAVPGREYEEIMSGPRNGMFINRSGNARDGDAFVLVKRSGREFHIYGKGADREVVRADPAATPDAVKPDAVKPDAVKPDAVKPDAVKPSTGSDEAIKAVSYEDVPGRAFDEITSGARNGMFVNRSGNARDGEAFVLVKRPAHELHVYGTGKNRLVVRVIPPVASDDAKPVDKPETPAPVPASTVGTPGAVVLS